MAKRARKKVVRSNKKNVFFKILLPVLIILLILAIILSSNLTGNVVKGCVDTDKTAVSALGEIKANDASLLKKGSVTQGYTTVEDYCDGNSIVEFFCDNGHRDSQRIVCSRGCLNAACKP